MEHTTHENQTVFPLDENRFGGLTKLEYFALEMYKVMLAREDYREEGLLPMSHRAVSAAECLISALNTRVVF